MQKIYTKNYPATGWENLPSETTPINAASLNNFDDTLDALDTKLQNQTATSGNTTFAGTITEGTQTLEAKYATKGANQAGSIVYQSGWSGANVNLLKTANICILSGYFIKTSSIVENDHMFTLPIGYRSADNNIYIAAVSGDKDKTSRVVITTDGELRANDTTSATTTLAFSVVYFIC